MKMARYSFSRSIPAKFEHKLRRHKQTFVKIATTVVLDKDEICCDQGCNDIGVVIATKWRHYLLYLQQYFSVGTVLLKSITGAFSSNRRLNVREVKTESVRELSRHFGIKFLSLEIRYKKGKSWCLAVICRKRCAFDMQFHLIVVSIFLKTWVKDHGDSFGQLLQGRIWLVCSMALLLAVL